MARIYSDFTPYLFVRLMQIISMFILQFLTHAISFVNTMFYPLLQLITGVYF